MDEVDDIIAAGMASGTRLAGNVGAVAKAAADKTRAEETRERLGRWDWTRIYAYCDGFISGWWNATP